jgi:type II secretory pathway pseudopilin PulG
MSGFHTPRRKYRLDDQAGFTISGICQQWCRLVAASQRRFRFAQSSLHSDGFTIVELMIATLIFTVILVVVTVGVLSFTRGYYKGINSSATQDAARDVMNQIAQGVQYAGSSDQVTEFDDASNQWGCIQDNNINYFYYRGKDLTGAAGEYGVFKTDSTQPCDGNHLTPANLSQGTELLSLRMRLTNISVSDPSADPDGVSTIEIGVAYGDDDLLCSTSIAPTSPGGCDKSAADFTEDMYADNGDTAACKSFIGSQFCATSHLNTVVRPRLSSGN